MSRKLLLVVTGAFCLLMAFSPRVLGQDAVLPSMVIEDSNGAVLGPVVGFDGLNQPIVRIIDTGVDVPVLIEVRDDDRLVGPQNSTYFASAGCTGTPYHNPAFSFATTGLSKLSGFSHSVARNGVGGDQWVIRSALTTGGTSVTYHSIFTSSNDSCSDETNTISLRAASAVLNLDNEHPPPYSLR